MGCIVGWSLPGLGSPPMPQHPRPEVFTFAVSGLGFRVGVWGLGFGV